MSPVPLKSCVVAVQVSNAVVSTHCSKSNRASCAPSRKLSKVGNNVEGLILRRCCEVGRVKAVVTFLAKRFIAVAIE
jgi:hypothetical protein